MTIDQIFNTNEETGGISYGVSPISDRVLMVKHEIHDMLERITTKGYELASENKGGDLHEFMARMENLLQEEKNQIMPGY